jgi:nitrite reductase/ring-hydroxylating ferredoxin subunit
MNSRIFKLLLLLLLFSPLISCRKDKQSPPIQPVYVNIQLYPNTLDYIPISGWRYVTGGNRGLIVYRMTSDQFMAYERTCPYDPQKEFARVNVNSTGIIAVDSVCGSQFVLTDGSPIKGPSGYPLNQYQTSYNGDLLRIFN